MNPCNEFYSDPKIWLVCIVYLIGTKAYLHTTHHSLTF